MAVPVLPSRTPSPTVIHHRPAIAAHYSLTWCRREQREAGGYSTVIHGALGGRYASHTLTPSTSQTDALVGVEETLRGELCLQGLIFLNYKFLNTSWKIKH